MAIEERGREREVTIIVAQFPHNTTVFQSHDSRYEACVEGYELFSAVATVFFVRIFGCTDIPRVLFTAGLWVLTIE